MFIVTAIVFNLIIININTRWTRVIHSKSSPSFSQISQPFPNHVFFQVFYVHRYAVWIYHHFYLNLIRSQRQRFLPFIFTIFTCRQPRQPPKPTNRNARRCLESSFRTRRQLLTELRLLQPRRYATMAVDALGLLNRSIQERSTCLRDFNKKKGGFRGVVICVVFFLCYFFSWKIGGELSFVFCFFWGEDVEKDMGGGSANANAFRVVEGSCDWLGVNLAQHSNPGYFHIVATRWHQNVWTVWLFFSVNLDLLGFLFM